MVFTTEFLLTYEQTNAKIVPAQALLQDSPSRRNPAAPFHEPELPPLTDGRSVAETPGVWHVASCRAKHVKAYAFDLLKLSRLTDGAVNFMLPMELVATVNSAGQRRRAFKRPLFPGMIFVCVADDAIEIDPNHRTFPQFKLTVSSTSQDRFRSDLMKVESFALNDPGTLELWPQVREGMLVQVQTGAYRGMKAYVIELNNGKRKLVVVFQDMACAAAVELNEHTVVTPI